MELFGKNIKKVRKRWRMDQDDFGEFMASSRGMISLYERGQNAPSLIFVSRLVKLSGISFLTMYETELLDSDIPHDPLTEDQQTSAPTVIDRAVPPQSNTSQKDLYNYHTLVNKVSELDAILQEFRNSNK